MLYSHSYQESVFEFFASFLRNVLAGDTRYVPLVEAVLSDTKLFVNKQKDHFAVNRTAYDIIIYLAKKDPTFFERLDMDRISKDQYSHILNMITDQKELLLA